MLPLLLAIAIAAPGVVAWWTGRKLVRFRDDPALPELLMARRQRLLLITWAIIIGSIFFAGQYWFWVFFLTPVSLLVGGNQVRRKLMGHTSNVVTFIWGTLKSVIGTAGFWMLLAMTPSIVGMIDARYRLYALALIPVLLAWEHWYMRLWLALHDARPLHNEALAPRVASIVQRAGIVAPELYMIGAPGTRFVNAVALPDLHRPAIALGNAIMELLEPDEVAAVYAHELAHIEEHGPRKLRRLRALGWLLIVLAVGLPLLAWQFFPSQAFWVSWLWPIVIFAVLLQRGRDRQKHETESDLRAAALTGDPESVVRGLIKIHVHAFIPRRWAVNFERSATHPSLARRIQALRGQGAEAVASLGAPTVLATARQSRVVVFDDARAWWFDGVPEGTANDLETLRAQASGMRSVTWRDLVELRVAVDGDDRALKATHKNGDTWSVPLEPAQVADVQKALDVVDVRLRRDLGVRPTMNVRLVAALTLIATWTSGSMGLVTLPALLALFKPSTASLAAMGAIVASHETLAALQGERFFGSPIPQIALAAAVTLGVIALIMAWRRATRDAKRDGLRLTLAVVGGLAALMIAGVAMAATRMSVADLGEYSVLPALAATLFGLAAAVVVTRVRRWALSGSALAAAALGVGAFSSVARAKGSTPAEFTRANASATEIRRANLRSPGASNLRVSPGGSHFIVEKLGQYGYNPLGVKRQLIGLGSGKQRELDAIHAEFLDEERLLVMRPAGDSLELRLERAESGTTEWRAKLPWLEESVLVVSRSDPPGWMVAGLPLGQDSLVVIGGAADLRARPIRRLAAFDSIRGRPRFVLPGGLRVLTPIYQGSGNVPLPLTFFTPALFRVALWEVSPSGRRHVADIDGFPHCGNPGGTQVVCLTRGSRRQNFWLIDSSGTARQVGSVRNYDVFPSVGPGARVLLSERQGYVESIDAAAKTMTRIKLGDEGYVTESRMAGDRLVVIRQDSLASVVIYRVQ